MPLLLTLFHVVTGKAQCSTRQRPLPKPLNRRRCRFRSCSGNSPVSFPTVQRPMLYPLPGRVFLPPLSAVPAVPAPPGACFPLRRSVLLPKSAFPRARPPVSAALRGPLRVFPRAGMFLYVPALPAAVWRSVERVAGFPALSSPPGAGFSVPAPAFMEISPVL